MTKTAAPLETAIIEKANRFDATIFLGRGQYHTATFDNLADARSAASQFGGVVKNGRKGMVYAIAEGRSIFVPDDYQPTKGLIDMTTEISSTEISRLTAILLGEAGYKRANSKAAAIKRFITVATEKGVKNPAEIAKGPFDMAEHVCRETLKGGHMTIAEVVAARDGAEPAKATDYPLPAAKPARRKALAAIADASRPAKPVKAPNAAKAAKAAPEGGKRAAILAAAERGELPAAPDFSAETHKRFRNKLADVVALVEAGEIKKLEAFAINPISSSPKAIDKYRNLAVIALKARKAAA